LTSLLIYTGVIFGAIFTYGIEENDTPEYQLFSKSCKAGTVTVGDTLIIQGQSSHQRYFCTIDGKVYRNEAGNDIQESVSVIWYNSGAIQLCL